MLVDDLQHSHGVPLPSARNCTALTHNSSTGRRSCSAATWRAVRTATWRAARTATWRAAVAPAAEVEAVSVAAAAEGETVPVTAAAGAKLQFKSLHPNLQSGMSTVHTTEVINLKDPAPSNL